MSDVAFGLSSGTLDDIATAIYERQYPDHFKDRASFSEDGTDYTLDWDVSQAPTFDLSSDDGSTFHVDLPRMDLTLTVDGTPADDTASVRIAATVDASGSDLVATPLSATVSTGRRFDDWVYNDKVVPIALEVGRQLLAGIPLPVPDVEGISLTQPVVWVGDDHLVLTADVEGESPGRDPDRWPDEPVFAVLGPNAVRAATDVATGALDGQSDSPHDETNIGVGTAYYKATVTVDDVRGDGWVSDDLTTDVTASVSGSGSAGIEWIIGGSTDGFFDLSLDPDPVATVRLALDDAVLSASTAAVGGFELVLTPTDGDLVSEVLSWIVDALSGFISPYVSGALEGISFEVYRVPTLHVDLDGVDFDAMPVDLDLSADDGTITVRGRLDITG
ncbi:hypothetical protein [Saccharothrix xinjiangensis]|uniref:Uncharacterized protein n=1 Tax=Saccharothrix xinjiangensis TaxID=204798 RepID=A0ABV9XYF5_9PSEU